MTEDQRKRKTANYRRWRRKNLAYNAARTRAWRAKNRERCKVSARIYKEKNKDRIDVVSKIWRDKNKARLRVNHQAWACKNREHMMASLRKWRAANIDKVRANRNRSNQRKRAGNVSFRIESSIRRRINSTLRGRTRHSSAINLLGCSIENFRIYLESKFEPGMSWENWGCGAGHWNIDHIMPCAIFDLSRPEHQKRCFHFSNQQPLWWEDNAAKHAKVLTDQFQLL